MNFNYVSGSRFKQVVGVGRNGESSSSNSSREARRALTSELGLSSPLPLAPRPSSFLMATYSIYSTAPYHYDTFDKNTPVTSRTGGSLLVLVRLEISTWWYLASSQCHSTRSGQ